MFRLLVLTALTGGVKCSTNLTTMSVRAVDFEIFGRVQGVFFRKYTKQQADKIGLRGWCKNTPQGTVQGQMQGPADKVQTIYRLIFFIIIFGIAAIIDALAEKHWQSKQQDR